jgi:glycosyltransferase involved in cell wall biosynthesis
MQPLVSIILPVFNAEKYLEAAIESILNQTHKNFELIIIEDGSSDRSLHIIERMKLMDGRVICIQNEKNKGLVKSLNIGLKRANGKYIARMDADDVSLSDRLEYQVNFLELNQDCFLVAGSYEIIDGNNTVIRTIKREYSSDVIEEKLKRFGAIHHPTVMFRNNHELFYRENAKHCEDRDLWLRLISEGKKLVVTREIVLKYRIHVNSITTQNSEVQGIFIRKVLEWHAERALNGYDSYEKFDPLSVKTTSLDTRKVLNQRYFSNSFLSSQITNYQIRKSFFEMIIKKDISIYFLPKALLIFIICSLPELLSSRIRILIREKWN